MSESRVGEVDPVSAWRILEEQPGSALVDVRTRAEWSFVGTPDLAPVGKQVILAEWRRYPDMSINGGFVDELLSHFDARPSHLLFICRSGARSMEAATVTAARLEQQGHKAECLNVAEGFEGNLDVQGHRGRLNGWKARGLAWRQS